MSAPLEVEVTPLAVRQLEAAARWWAENRPSAPDAIRTDFEAALVLLSRQPHIGAKSRTKRYPDLRRLYLRRVRYHVYYDIRPSRILVLAFWHGSRGREPQL